MKISDLKLGQTGYYGYLHCRPDQVTTVKFVEAKIDGNDYIVCIKTERNSSPSFEVQEEFKDFFETFGTFYHSEDETYSKNYECFLTKEELFENNRSLILEKELKKLEEKKNSLLDIKKKLLETEQSILEMDLKKAKLQLEEKYKRTLFHDNEEDND